jgi:predicted RND superfamily exporter protein
LDLEAGFGSNTDLFFLIVSDEDIYDSNELALAADWLTTRAWEIEGVVAVDSLASFPYAHSSDSDLIVSDVLDYLCPSGQKCRRDREAAARSLYIENRFVDESLKALAVIAKVDLQSPSSDLVSALASEAVILQHEVSDRFPDLKVYLTGGVSMMQAFMTAAAKDSTTLVAFALLVFFVALWFFLGGFFPTAVMMITSLSSVVMALGIAGWSGHVLNTATATSPLVILTLVIASSMHVFIYIVREEKVESQKAVHRIVKTAINANIRPLILTTATTVLGFLSLLFVSAPPIRQLGAVAAIGVSIGMLLTLTFVPAAFSLRKRLKPSALLQYSQRFMNRYARRTETQSAGFSLWIFPFTLAMYGVVFISIDEDFVRYFSQETEFRSQTEVITERLAGPYHLDIVYDSLEEGGVFGRQALSELRDLSLFLRRHPSVVNVLSVVDVLDQVAIGFALGADVSDMPKDEVAQLFLSYELSLGKGQSTQDLIDAGYRRTRVSVLLGDVSMKDIRHLAGDIEEWKFDRMPNSILTVTGEGMPTAYLSSESIAEMGFGILMSLTVSALVVGLFFKRISVGLIIFSAIMVPILAGFGLWGWFGSDMGMAATLVVATTIGVVVDDTIHLAYRYIDGLTELDLEPSGAAGYSIHKAGLAILITSVVLVAGLLVLVFSEFRMNSTFGICASLIIVLALLYNMIVSPRLLKMVSGVKASASGS